MKCLYKLFSKNSRKKQRRLSPIEAYPPTSHKNVCICMIDIVKFSNFFLN